VNNKIKIEERVREKTEESLRQESNNIRSADQLIRLAFSD